MRYVRYAVAVTVLVLSGCMPTFALAKEVTVSDPSKLPPGIELMTELGTPVVLADRKQTAFLKVGLKGNELDKLSKHTPVNVSIVIDRSGSMQGDKLANARTAAIMAVHSLADNDIVSVVTYDDTVQVVVPSTSAANKEAIATMIESIQPGGSTALFAGVSYGAAELRKALSRERVNRVILLSDGLANVGPSSPGELAELGSSLAKEGISVTTLGLGLGFNEDLMMQLARASDGNHAFVERPEQLAGIFKSELGDVLSVVAQNVDVEITCTNGVKPVRVLGREAVIEGNKITTRLNQLYAQQEKFLLIEVELPALPAEASKPIADVVAEYADMRTGKRQHLQDDALIKASTSQAAVDKAAVKAVLVAAAEMLANEQSKLAVALRDQGKVEEARRVFKDNAARLQTENLKLNSPKLQKLEEFNSSIGSQLDDAEWNRSRKVLRNEQYSTESQQSYH